MARLRPLFLGALGHPKLADCRHDDRDGVIGIAKKRFGFGGRSDRAEQGASSLVGAMEQDRQQERTVLDGGEITQRRPGSVAELHCGEEPHGPGARKDGAVIGTLEDRCIVFRSRCESFADGIEASNNCHDGGGLFTAFGARGSLTRASATGGFTVGGVIGLAKEAGTL